MSYAIIRNEKMTRTEAKGSYVHNERRTKGHTNKDIDSEKTHLNYYLKKNELSYIKEFDRLKKENDLQGHIRSNSIIMCEMLFTSDKEFFDKIGEKETKRYFEESYNSICSYKRSNVSEDSSKLVTEESQGVGSRNKNLGEKNIISAVVHLDEGTPHMHLIYIPVIHTKDKEGKEINKICCRDFWKGRDSYRQLQNAFFEYITSKGFELERELPIEETGAKHEKIENLKKITNFENTKKILNNIKLDLPQTPNINDIKLIKLNREKVEDEIIKPKDKLINELYQENVLLHKELSKQVNLVNEAEKYQKERNKLKEDNEKLYNQVENIKVNYEEKAFDLEWKYKNKIKSLEKENSHLNKVIDKFYEVTEKFIKWICKKFDIGAEDNLIRDFEKDTKISLDAEKQIKQEDREKDWNLER